ncbi:putative leucine-rich repeat domain superfamily, F-box-like domain superfamily [Helianthus annuus]|nr:putative leucine-rich repeat domain superfamily, F-box-like domain superfamily [Helianthus annuus]KAJ0709628.1 putative leucine-rich repeat domain superfamily, F-box-like domain superfamily [Helianthus annuus]
MFINPRRLIIDSRLKSRISANKLLMIKRKKYKTGRSSRLGGPAGYDRKLVVKEGQTLASGSCKKGVSVIRESKRKFSSVLRKGIRGRKKRKMEKIDKVDEIVEPVDRISDLPEPIIHHILSLLRCPKDVTRTTVWSKKWRSVCASFFTFDFDQKKIQTSGRKHPEKFITFVDNSLATKLEPMHNIQKFKISLSKASIRLILPMNNWINAAINKDVKELDVHMEENSLNKHYLLPNTVLTSKNLTSLKLYGCKFDSNIIINLCNLKELSIKNAYVNTDLINNFIQGCPLVEDLRLIHCKGIGHLHISTLHKLHSVQLHECHGLVSVKIELTSLHKFLYWVKSSWQCSLNLSGCENLKSLSIKDPSLSDKFFQDLIVKFPYLEKIVLRECNRLKRITILSKTLTELSVIECNKLKDPLIDAPNLSAFEYTGERMPFFLMDVSGLHEAKLQFRIKKTGLALCRELEQFFLKKFVNDGAWKLVVSSNKNITIHEELPKVQHLSSKELKLELTKSPMKLKDFVDNLLRMSQPKTLSLVSSSSSELLNFMKEKIMSREKNPKCCTYYSRKCWLHRIKDVTMVVLFEGAEIGDMGHDSQQTTFKFNWQTLKSKTRALVNDS